MKKTLVFTLFMTFTLSSFAVDVPNRSIFMEGTARNQEQRTFFMTNFRMEASALGYTVAETRAEAGYIFRFEVHPFEDEWDPHIQNIILITLTHNELDLEMVSFGWPFGELEDMFEHNQFVFYRAAVLIPGLSDADLAALAQAAESAGTAIDTSWQNKWVYLTASLNYPIVFYTLKPDGLVGGAIYADGPNGPENLSRLNHIVMPYPGVSLGVQVQPLNLLSVGINFQMTLGDPFINQHINMAAGAELKFNIKTDTFMFQPFGAFVYHLDMLSESPSFDDFPQFSFGGGLKLSVRAGPSAGLFIYVSYLTSLEGVSMFNNFNPLAPNPAVVQFDRFVLGLGVGYKMGFLDRKR
jgi:hypothetical protein